MKELIGSCPYCGPNYSDIPNLLEAVRGYDMAHGNPFPGRLRFRLSLECFTSTFQLHFNSGFIFRLSYKRNLTTILCTTWQSFQEYL